MINSKHRAVLSFTRENSSAINGIMFPTSRYFCILRTGNALLFGIGMAFDHVMPAYSMGEVRWVSAGTVRSAPLSDMPGQCWP